MKKTILIIDDDIDILHVLQLGLEDSEFEVEIAASTELASRILSEKNISLVVCDLTLANESGIDFLKRMKTKLENVPPFIICSGFPLKQSQIPDQGIVGFLSKPFSIPQLIKMIKNHLN